MKSINIRILLIVSALIAASVHARWSQPASKAQCIRPDFNAGAQTAPDVIVIKRRAGIGKANERWAAALRKLGSIGREPVFTAVQDTSSLSRIERVYLTSGQDVFEAAALAMADPAVEWAEPRYVCRLHHQPDDAYLSYQWYLEQIQMFEAWDVYRGTGTVIIAIVDTGVDSTHEDLKPVLWHNQAELGGTPGFDDDRNGFVDDVWGWDFGEEDADPSPSTWQNIHQRKQYHGTWAAGVAGALANNGKGIASPVYRAQIMAVKVTEDDNVDQVFYADQGAQGIVYAADQGARVINCSWGGEMSNATRDAVAYALNQGAIVIASASNEDVDHPSYPAAFEDAMSVASTNQDDRKSGFSNYHTSVDISAPGSSIYTTNEAADNGYKSVSGTSFSSPLAASLIALVMDQRPDFTAEQVREQVRVSADPIDHLNPGYAGKLGWGRLNALNALTGEYQSLRMMDADLLEAAGNNADGILEPGESIDFVFSIVNYLKGASGVRARVIVDNPDVTVNNGTWNIGVMTPLEDQRNTWNPVTIHLDEDAPSGQTLEIQVRITTAEGYEQIEVLTVDVIPPYNTIEAGNASLTLTSFGRFGAVDIDVDGLGSGFQFGTAGNLLFEGAIMAGTHSDSLSDCARGDDPLYGQNLDFFPVDGGELMLRNPGDIADSEALAEYQDTRAESPLGLKIRQRAVAFDAAADDDYVILTFDLINAGTHALNRLWFGLFMDWDIEDSANNRVGLDAQNQWAYTTDESGSVYGGLAVLNMDMAVYRAYDNRAQLDDGYTDAMKFSALQDGVGNNPSESGKDYSQVVGVGPFHLIPGDTLTVGMAMVGGNTLSHFEKNARAAGKKWIEVFGQSSDASDAEDVILERPYPNPFMKQSTLRCTLTRGAELRVTVIDQLGREVAVLFDGLQSAGIREFVWDGRDKNGPVASGVYFYRVKVENELYIKKCIRLTDL